MYTIEDWIEQFSDGFHQVLHSPSGPFWSRRKAFRTVIDIRYVYIQSADSRDLEEHNSLSNNGYEPDGSTISSSTNKERDSCTDVAV